MSTFFNSLRFSRKNHKRKPEIPFFSDGFTASSLYSLKLINKESLMGNFWSHLLSGALSAAAGAVIIDKWMKIEDSARLRLTIRSDIRNFNVDTIKMYAASLETSIKQYSFARNDKLRDQAVVVRELLIEEANRARQ